MNLKDMLTFSAPSIENQVSDKLKVQRLNVRLLLDSKMLCTLLIWGLNDHFLKYKYPGFIVGKLSDVTSLICTPILMLIVTLWISSQFPWLIKKIRWNQQKLYSLLLLYACLMAFLMVAINLNSQWAYLYCQGLGIAQWPWVGLWSYYQYGAWPPIPQVILTMDAGDAWTAPTALLSLGILRSALIKETLSI